MAHQTTTVVGTEIRVKYGMKDETHAFAAAAEADSRAAIIEQALSWIGTPFRNCADIKGPNGGIDCAMLLVRSYVDSGKLAPFDPRPYPPDWFLHRREQRFLKWIEETLGAHRVDAALLGDVYLWQFGLCFSHGGIAINSTEVVHAYGVAGLCLVSRTRDDELDKVTIRGHTLTRPRLTFDVWGR